MTKTLDEKLEWAREWAARWANRIESANKKYDTAHEMGGGILGFGGSGSQRAAKQVRSAFNAADRAYKEAEEKHAYYSGKVRYYERRIEERDRTRLTREEITGARWVRTHIGWHKVVRVNAKTVSTDSGYDWVDRYEFDKILEVLH